MGMGRTGELSLQIGVPDGPDHPTLGGSRQNLLSIVNVTCRRGRLFGEIWVERMDRKLIGDAIHRAIKGGAVQAPPVPGTRPDDDINFVRAQTDVGIEPTVFENYVAALKCDPDMALFDSTFATVPTGGGISTGLQSISKLLLARAIGSGDVSGTVERFCSYIEKNSTSVLAVMAVSGVKAATEVSLGPDIKLVPMKSLTPSIQRGAALGQDQFSRLTLRDEISCALVTTLEFKPIFYRPSEGGVPSAQAQQRVMAAFHHLDEARTLYSLLGISPAFRMFWVQPKDLLMTAGVMSGWNFNPQAFRGQDVEVDAKAAEDLATAYFRIGHQSRNKMLRIPLDRLDKAAHGYDFTDRSIDLGIALEALLLHDLDGQDRGELRFRLSLRGAWLGAKDEKERAVIQAALKKMYDLRSRAVHSGMVDQSPPNRETISQGAALCKQLIRKIIDADCRIDWNALVLGGASDEA